MEKLAIKYMSVMDLKPYVNNPRKNDKAVDAVAASIREFGFKVPIVLDKDMTIITGHTRLKAAIKLGLQEVPVIIATDLTPEKVKAFRLADNKVAEIAEWDLEALEIELADLKEMDMSAFGFEIEGTEMDNVKEDNFEVELPEEPKSKYGQVYQLGRHRLMVGDSTKPEDVEKLMNYEQADCYITDPPYNIDYSELQKTRLRVAPERFKGANTDVIENDKMSDADFIDFMERALSATDGILKPGGAFYIWHATTSDYTTQQAMRNVGWQVRQIIIWKKSSLCLGFSDYQWIHEPCMYGWKSGGSHYFISDRSLTTIYEDGINIQKIKLAEARELLRKLLEPKEAASIIYEPKPLANSDHPTMKPVRLMARIMLNSTRRGEIVYDGFAGSGSTLIAAEQTDRRAYVMELYPKYADVIIKRYEEFTGDKAVLIEG